MTDEQQIAEVELALDGVSLAEAREAFRRGYCARWNEFFSVCHGIFEFSRKYEVAADFEAKLLITVGKTRTEEIERQEQEKLGACLCQGNEAALKKWRLVTSASLDWKERELLRLEYAGLFTESEELTEEQAEYRLRKLLRKGQHEMEEPES